MNWKNLIDIIKNNLHLNKTGVSPYWDETVDKNGYFGDTPFCGNCDTELEENFSYCPYCRVEIDWGF